MSYKQSINSILKVVRLYEAQGGKCYICGGMMPAENTKPIDQKTCTTVDHVWPRNTGHDYLGGNALLAHGLCNSKKSDRLPTICEQMYLEYINMLLGWDGECYLNTPEGKKVKLYLEIMRMKE